MFNNLGIIRRYYLEKFRNRKTKGVEVEDKNAK
jgi:hypothetical protein